MLIKQGTILPTTGIGIGYLLLFIYGGLMYNFGIKEILNTPAAYILPFIFTLMQFTYKDFIIDDNMQGYKNVYRYFFIPVITSPHAWNEYSVFVLRVLNTKYSVMQSGTGGFTSGEHRESRTVIVGRSKKSKQNVLICTGKKSQLDKVIKDNIMPSEISVYLGAPKKGYEYVPK